MKLPLLLTLLVSGSLIIIGQIHNFAYILLLTAAVFAILTNGQILIGFIVKNVKLSGGGIAHLGVAFMLLGILFSSGYSTVISNNNTGRIYSKEFSEEMNRDNILLWLNEPREMNDFKVTYKGTFIEARKIPGYIEKDKVVKSTIPHLAIATDTISQNGKIYHLRGDTLEIYPENTYYEIEYEKNGKKFNLFPRAQVNPNMGLIASPDIKKFFGKDLYTHVSSIPDPEQEPEWSELQEHQLKVGEQFFIGDYVAVLEGVQRINTVHQVSLGDQDVAVKAKIRVYGSQGNYIAEPVYLIKDRMLGRIPDQVKDLGIKVNFMNVHPETDSFTIGSSTTQRDYVIMKAMEKPMINLLWIGCVLVMIGFGITVGRRYSDFRKMRDKGIE